MASIPSSIERQLASLPDAPGVYLWKDADGRVLYVGKAKRLRSRVRSYFQADGSDPKHRMLLAHIADLETLVVPSESQALLLENNLVKEHRPRFNVQLRDDKSYPRIAVTVGEPFPRVLVVRRVDVPGARYFGPYTDVGVLRRTLRIIRRIFTVRSCHYGLPTDAPDRPCLDYHIHRCLAPCVGYQTQDDYRAMIDDVLAFLEGKTVEVRRRLRERMDDASRRLDFERAAEIRDGLKWLEQLEQPQTVEYLAGGGDADVIGYARDGADAVAALLRVREGRVIARDHQFLENLTDEADDQVLSTFLVQDYLHADAKAQRVLLPFEPADQSALEAIFSDTTWHVPQRGAAQRLIALADQNARHLMEGFRIESFEADERAEDPVYALGRDLGLTTVPRSMVCIDVSTNVGRDTVGSLVWFEAGRPKKSEYRKFRIRGTTEGQEREGRQQRQVMAGPAASHPAAAPAAATPDDYAAIREVVARYLTRRVAETQRLPDLMVIDGGKGQLGAAQAAQAEVGVAIHLASLAKREEEVFLPGRKDALRLSLRSPSLKLLQRARDEAHRFAVAYSRRRRTKRTVTSELLEIPGVGEKRRRQLIDAFGSLAGVRLATPAEIAALPGFSEKLASRILAYLAR